MYTFSAYLFAGANTEFSCLLRKLRKLAKMLYASFCKTKTRVQKLLTAIFETHVFINSRLVFYKDNQLTVNFPADIVVESLIKRLFYNLAFKRDFFKFVIAA